MRKKNWLILTIGCLFLSVSGLRGQDIDVAGTVIDGESGEPVIGATILLKGTSEGTVTDFDGNYVLKVKSPNDTLMITYIGYKEMIIPVNARNTIDVVLEVFQNQLDEVIVVGYGRQKKKVVTGAVSRVSAEQISSTPTLRVEQALQGRTAGVQVTNQSGQPGEEPTVRVRGIGTTGSAKPLYIVDGLAVGSIDYLNPGDIESIDVLKDAASAAIYGARAANGVVLVTTNSGSDGKLNVSYNGYYGVQNTTNRLEMLNAEQYRMYMNEGARNAGLTEPFDLAQIPTHDTDWQEALFEKNAPIQNHQISISGGNKKSTFASSLSYFSQEGVIGGPKSKFERYTARINSKHKVSEIFNFGGNLAFTHLDTKGIGSNTSFNGAYSSAINLDPLTPVIESDENILNTYPYSDEPVVQDESGNTYGISDRVGAEVVNPLALLAIDNDKTRKDQIVGNVFGEIKPIKDLTFRSSLGIDMAYLLNDGFRPIFFLNGAQLNDNKTTVNKKIERFYTWQWENTLSYQKEIGDHTVGGLLGISASEYNYEDLFGFNSDVPTSDPNNVYLNLATDTTWTASGGAAHSALYSQFGRLQYSYKDKYSLTAIVRRDGSSKFGANQRFGIFPSVGVAWVVSDESFLKDNLGMFNYVKMRASWGINGNQEIGDYQFLSTIDQGRRYTLGGGAAVGSSPSFIENADIRWEESEQLNFGIDMGLFENKVQATFDYYVKSTKGLLEKVTIPGHVGNDGPISNVGSIRNTGVEWDVSWRHASGKLKYSIGINGAYNINEVTNIGNTEKVINGASWALAGVVTRSEEGLPIAYFWGHTTDGIFQNQSEVFQHINREGELLQPNAVAGDVKFVDLNQDGVINSEDRTNLGNPTPDFTLGINVGAETRGFDISVFLQGAFGHEIFNGTQRQDLRFTNRTVAALDRWTGEGTSTTTPRYTWIDRNNNYRVSDLYIEDGSYMRIKNLQFGYSLSPRILDKIGAVKWRLYISAENLFTFTGYTGVDPEIGSSGTIDASGRAVNTFDIGIDRAVYPQAKTMRFGTSITF